MADTESSNWHGVPREYQQAWDKAIFDSHDPFLYLSSSCPICLSKTLHRWYMVGKLLEPPFPYASDGITFVARGALWVWCSTCRVSEHCSAAVPDFWNPSSEFEVNVKRLTVYPTVLEEARRRWEEKH